MVVIASIGCGLAHAIMVTVRFGDALSNITEAMRGNRAVAEGDGRNRRCKAKRVEDDEDSPHAQTPFSIQQSKHACFGY